MNNSMHSLSEEDTANIAQKLAGGLQSGDVLCLSGPLGAGKSVFARALIRAMTGQKDLVVPSPTFTLVQEYESAPARIYHFDLYRIVRPDEIFELGWEEALSGITIIEWPERLGGLAPGDRLDISFAHTGNETQGRLIDFAPKGAMKDRWKDETTELP